MVTYICTWRCFRRRWTWSRSWTSKWNLARDQDYLWRGWSTGSRNLLRITLHDEHLVRTFPAVSSFLAVSFFRFFQVFFGIHCGGGTWVERGNRMSKPLYIYTRSFKLSTDQRPGSSLRLGPGSKRHYLKAPWCSWWPHGCGHRGV